MSTDSKLLGPHSVQLNLSMTPTISPKYRPDIDGLRAIAVLLVVGFHTFPNLVRGGFIGVDIFFVISGFLISTILLQNLQNNTFHFSEFYARRIKRIFPALLIVLIVCYGMGWVVLLADEYKQLGKHIAGGGGFIANFIFWSDTGYFDNSAETKPLLHLWSLGVEEQFYIIWPLLLWIVYKKKINLPITIVLVGVVSFICSVRAVYMHPLEAFYAPWTRVWELLCGTLLAWSSLHKKDLNKNSINGSCRKLIQNIMLRIIKPENSILKEAQALLGLLFIGLGTCLFSKESHFPGILALLPTLGATLIIAAGSQAWINRKILAHPLFVWFGLISYPFYLWHYPLLSFLRIMEGKTPSAFVRIIAMVVALGLAWLTYELIEKPIRFKLNNEKRKIITLLIAMTILCGIGLLSYYKNGFAFRYKKIDRIQSQFQWSPWLGKPPYASVVLIGDSHAGHLGPGLREEGLESFVADYSSAGCIPFYDIDVYSSRKKTGLCKENMNSALEFIEKSESIKTVILANRGPLYLTAEYFLGGHLHRVEGQRMTLEGRPDLMNHRWEIYRISMRNTLIRLLTKHKKIIFVVDNPELDFEPRSCIERTFYFWGKTKNPCAIDRESYDKRTSEYRQMIFDVLKEFPQVKVFDVAQKLCDTKWCWALKDGKMLYLDADHLSHDGSTYIAQFLAPIIRETL